MFSDIFKLYIAPILKAAYGITDINDISKFNLPQLVVIGDEKAGKSSLLENIVGISVFPKDRAFCTKCPVIFNLRDTVNYSGDPFICEINKSKKTFQNEKDVYEIIKKHMDSLEKIIETPITVTYYHKENLNFSFVDLPGIRANPQSDRIISEQITTNYVNDMNNYIICVVSSRCDTLANYNTFSRLANTPARNGTNYSIVLTNADRVYPDDFEFLVLNRVDKKDKEIKALNSPNVYCVISKEIKEKQLFEKEFLESKSLLSDNRFGLENFIKVIKHNFMEHIKKNWKANIIADIESRKKQAMNELNNIGTTDPKKLLEWYAVLEYFLNTEFFSTFINKFENLDLVKLELSDETISLYDIVGDSKEIKMSEALDNPIFYKEKRLRSIDKQKVKEYLLQIDFDIEYILNEFFKEHGKKNLQRFSHHAESIKKDYLKELEKIINSELICKAIDNIITFYDTFGTFDDDRIFTRFSKIISRSFPSIDFSNYLTESEETIKKRKMLSEKIIDLENRIKLITE